MKRSATILTVTMLVMLCAAPAFAYDESRSGFGGDNFTNFGAAAFGEGLEIDQVARTEAPNPALGETMGVETIEPAAGADADKSAANPSDKAPTVEPYIFP
jgi:hypothetical protein